MKVHHRAIGLPLSVLVELLTDDGRWHRIRDRSGVPEGAVPIRVYCEANGHRVIVVFSHESFPESELDNWHTPIPAQFEHAPGRREPEPLDTLESLTAHVTKPRSRRPVVRST